MELTTINTDLAQIKDIPQEAKVGKLPLAPFLPKDLAQKMKSFPMVHAEISQSMLKSSNDAQIKVFTARVLNFINPKFDDPDVEIELAEVELYSFASKCELTCDEFMLALDMAVDGKLTTPPDDKGKTEVIKLYREIDRLKLGEIKNAYINHKRNDKKYEEGKEILKKALNPPIEKTPEQIHAEKVEWLKMERKRLLDGELVRGSILFYDIIKKKGVETVKLKFVESTLLNFNPDNVKGGLGNMPIITKNDCSTYFKDCLVKSYIDYHKLKNLTEDEWVKYWLE